MFNWAVSTLIYLAKTLTLADSELEPIYPDSTENTPYHLNSNDREEEDMVIHPDEQEEPPSGTREKEFDQRLLIQKTKPEPCDHELYLYSLIHYTDRNISHSGYNKSMNGCSRPFIVHRISQSNMILLVINNVCRADVLREEIILSRLPEPVQVDYNMSLACYRVRFNNFTRNYMDLSCINRNANESEIKLCGSGNNVSPSNFLSILITFYLIIYYVL